jgi:alpha-glucosidase
MMLLPALLAFASYAASAAVDSCPGYAASNVVKTTNSLTASLSLAGDACNAYGDDIANLTLLVEFQSGAFMVNAQHKIRNLIT